MIVGAKIKVIREMTNNELNENGWDKDFHHTPMAIEFDNGDILYPSRDDEGNGYGSIFGKDKKGNFIRLSIK